MIKNPQNIIKESELYIFIKQKLLKIIQNLERYGAELRDLMEITEL